MAAVSEPEVLWPVGAELGEGPVWSARDRAVWFVDIKSRKIHRLAVDGFERRSWDAPEQVGFILPTATGGWVVGLQSGLHSFDPATARFWRLSVPEAHGPANRLNDGHVDARGRLWFGSMHDSEGERAGALYRLLPDGRSRLVDPGYMITNGPATSPDGRVLYHTDTADRVIFAFDLAADGSLSGKREFLRITREGAHPDGHVVDSEGCVWVSLFGGWGVERYSPEGELLEYVRFPVANITKIAFGGSDLKTAYATTAKLHLSAEQRREQPLAGALFSFRTDVAGLPQNEISHGV